MEPNRQTGNTTFETKSTVVINKVSMSYTAQSTETQSKPQENAIARLIARTFGRPTMVTVNALNEISLLVCKGESVGIVGRNGSGKSTLMRLISGQNKPSTGSVYASSVPIMLGVNAALVPELSGDHNIVLGCLAMGLTHRDIESKFDSILDLSGLGKAIYLPMKSYSSGMASRLRFAIAASVDPEILLIDEALNTGDAQFRDRSKNRMDELRSKAGSVFLVSHSLDTITEMCTRVIWLDKGELLMDGDPEIVTKAYARYAYHLAQGNDDIASKLRASASRSLVKVSIEPRLGRRGAA